MIIGRQFAERFYSESDYEEERLYSTGNDELDELLERAFCDGYEYAQREFAEEEEEEKKGRTGLRAGIGGTLGAGAGVGAAYGGKKLGKKILRSRAEKARNEANFAGEGGGMANPEKVLMKADKLEGQEGKVKEAYRKIVNVSEKPFQRSIKRTKENLEKANNAMKFATEGGTTNDPTKAIKAAEKATKAAERALKRAKAGGKALRYTAAAAPVVAAGATIAAKTGKKKKSE